MPSSYFPPSSLDIKIGDKPVTILMTFGLVNELAALVGGIERIAEVDFNPATTIAALAICLAPRDERGRLTDPDWSIPPNLGVEDGEAVLDFVKDHLMDFFIGRLEKHLAAIKENGERLTGVGSSLSGLAASASATR